MENAKSRATTSRSPVIDLTSPPTPSAAVAKHPQQQCQHDARAATESPPSKSHARSEPTILNSRREKRPGFAIALAPAPAFSGPPPEFFPPSPKIYHRARYQFRGARKKQIQLQPSKSELPRNASRRDKLKPYVLEPPIQAQRFPKHSAQYYPLLFLPLMWFLMIRRRILRRLSVERKPSRGSCHRCPGQERPV